MSDTLWFVRVYSKSLTRPTCDAALDLEHPDAGELLTDYARTRTPEALAALPVREGQTLTQWGAQRLSRGARKFVDEAITTTDRMTRAVQCGLVGVRAPGAAEKLYRRTKVGGVASAVSDADLDRVYDAVGQSGIDELGGVILAMSEAGEDDLAPFGSPPGLMLAR